MNPRYPSTDAPQRGAHWVPTQRVGTRGLLQQLLTGRIRVKTKEESV
jgi:hypothetical protein